MSANDNDFPSEISYPNCFPSSCVFSGHKFLNSYFNFIRPRRSNALSSFVTFALNVQMNLKLKDNYIVVNEEMKTNIPGVFACGDVIFKDVYQISTAIGEAATASVSVIKYLKNT